MDASTTVTSAYKQRGKVLRGKQASKTAKPRIRGRKQRAYHLEAIHTRIAVETKVCFMCE